MPSVLQQALDEALDDEYKAMATYEAAIAAYGPIRPFINIVEAERRHADALLQLYEIYDLEPQPNRWRGKVQVPPSVEEACREAVAAEEENAALYDRLIATVEQDDVKQVFAALRWASQESHLEAFRRCAAAEGACRKGTRRVRNRQRGCGQSG